MERLGNATPPAFLITFAIINECQQWVDCRRWALAAKPVNRPPISRLSRLSAIAASGYPLAATRFLDSAVTDLATDLSPASCQSARRLLKISQADLAAQAKVSTSTLRRFERGECGISDYARKQLALTLASEGILFLGGKRTIML